MPDTNPLSISDAPSIDTPSLGSSEFCGDIFDSFSEQPISDEDRETYTEDNLLSEPVDQAVEQAQQNASVLLSQTAWIATFLKQTP